MSKNIHSVLPAIVGMVVFGLLLVLPGLAQAGIYDASNEVTYKEYWISHSQFTGACLPDGLPEKPFGGSFYIEPNSKCIKTLSFQLPDDFSNAVKVEIYLDYWRNYGTPSSKFSFNGNDTVYSPPVGSDWSRTPYVAEIPKSELTVGTNTIKLWGTKNYHVHDIAFRIYYNDANPLVPGNGSDVTPPNGSLDTIEDDNGPVAPNSGGNLSINGEELTLTASVSGDVKFVEFHAWYEGYDEDNDGVFRDWHNLGRNNWFPGGTDENELGGVINHLGTVEPNGGTASVTWDLTNVTNQSEVRFKIRVVDASGNVRDAAGGDSAAFRMVRNKAVLGFIIPGFKDAGLHMFGSRPDTAQYDFNLPANIADFDSATVIGAYWRNPKFAINGSNDQSANSGDMWKLGVRPVNAGVFTPGKNRIIYTWSGGPGNFVEEPGPMFVFRKSSTGGDTQPPVVGNRIPAAGATGANTEEFLKANISDLLFGVDFKSVVLKVNGVDVSDKIRLDGLSSDYLLSYKPAGDWDFSTTYNISIEACDLAGNCMSAVNYSFTTAEPDTTPPVISNVVVAPRPNGAHITWTTNEPATSRVDYGTTNNHELGSVEDAVLKTAHELDIQGLTPATTYHFQLLSTDNQGNTKTTPDDTFLTDLYPDVSSDDFNVCLLDPKWEYINPKGDATLTMNGTQAIIAMPGGVVHDWTGNRPPRLMQLANDTNFTIDVKFDATVTSPIQMQGILVEQSATTYLYAGFEYLTDSVTGLPVLSQYTRFIKDGVAVKGARKFLPNLTNTPPLYMRLTRTGDSWEWFYSTNGTQWTKAATAYTFDISVLKAGVYVGNTGQAGGAVPAHTGVIDYFFNAASPIVPEDGNMLSLNLVVNGNGTAEKSPDQTEYSCGEEVTITATGAPGWFLESWTGDIASTNPVEIVIMDSSKSITANFAAIPYLLTVNIVNNGVGGTENTVTKSPDQPTYVYDDVVNLTAVPQPGWKFTGWSGALTGTELMKSVTMQQDIEVTATFEPILYTLDLQVESDGIGDGGTATATPSKTTYLYGDVVALVATPKPGWTFTGWTGAVTSTELEVELIMTDNRQVVAHFVQNQYELNIDVVSDGIGTGGVVTANPPKATYVYDEVVTLVAEPNPGWDFDSWSGDVTGTELTKQITIKDDTDVTATFVQENYELDITIIGQGTVKVEPDKQSYLFGDKVKLTATPGTNLFFGGWGGDLVGAQNPIELIIEGDTAVSALFTNNQPPTVNPIPKKSVRINKKVSFVVTATDPASEPIELTVDGLPEGAKFTDNGDGTGSFEWTPGLGDRGDFVITFIASDGTGVGSKTTTITVTGYGIALPAIANP